MQGMDGRGGNGRKKHLQGGLVGAGGSPQQGAVCGWCDAPLGMPPTHWRCIPWGLDAAGHAECRGSPSPLPPHPSSSLSSSITAADAARSDLAGTSLVVPCLGARGHGPSLFVWVISRKQSKASRTPGSPDTEPGPQQGHQPCSWLLGWRWAEKGQRKGQGKGNAT